MRTDGNLMEPSRKLHALVFPPPKIDYCRFLLKQLDFADMINSPMIYVTRILKILPLLNTCPYFLNLSSNKVLSKLFIHFMRADSYFYFLIFLHVFNFFFPDYINVLQEEQFPTDRSFVQKMHVGEFQGT